MTTTQARLSALLLLQLLIAAGLFWNSQQQQQQGLQQPLLSFEQSQVDRVVLADGDTTATLSRVDGNWQLPQMQQLPADSDKLDDLLSKLNALNAGWPVATTASGRERFEVAEDNFQRRLQLYRGDTALGELFVGTSPGFRKVHARRPGDDEIYSVALNSYELPVTDEAWLDKTLLSATGVDSIKGPDYALHKKEESWGFVTAAPEAEQASPKLNVEKAQQLASAVAGLRVDGVADSPPGEATPITLEVAGAGGRWTYQFMQADDNYYVRRDDLEAIFTISQFDYERITEIGMPQLALEDAQPEGEEVQPSDAS